MSDTATLTSDLEAGINNGSTVTVHMSNGSTVTGTIGIKPGGVAARRYIQVTATGGAVWRLPSGQVAAVVVG